MRKPRTQWRALLPKQGHVWYERRKQASKPFPCLDCECDVSILNSCHCDFSSMVDCHQNHESLSFPCCLIQGVLSDNRNNTMMATFCLIPSNLGSTLSALHNQPLLSSNYCSRLTIYSQMNRRPFLCSSFSFNRDTENISLFLNSFLHFIRVKTFRLNLPELKKQLKPEEM